MDQGSNDQRGSVAQLSYLNAWCVKSILPGHHNRSCASWHGVSVEKAWKSMKKRHISGKWRSFPLSPYIPTLIDSYCYRCIRCWSILYLVHMIVYMQIRAGVSKVKILCRILFNAFVQPKKLVPNCQERIVHNLGHPKPAHVTWIRLQLYAGQPCVHYVY